MSASEWDFIVVGAGSAGCALASYISEKNRVLLLEAGGTDSSPVIKIPMGVGLCDISRYDWGYHSASDPTRSGRSEAWTRGRIVGGSSSINGMNYVRGTRADYDRWAESGNGSWSASEVMHLFDQLERCDDSVPDVGQRRGRDGVLHIRMVRDPHSVVKEFIRATTSLGYSFTDDYNGNRQEGIGYAQLNQRGRRRWSAADAFLKPSLRRKTLHLLTGAVARKILFRGREVVGISYERHGMITEAYAKHVVLCAGAINTPHLLLLSGIGDPTVLRSHGIEAVADAKAVGCNLMEHPTIRLIYRMRVPTYSRSDSLTQKVRLLSKYLVRGDGPLAYAFDALAFLKTRPEEAVPDVQLHIAAFGFGDMTEVSLAGRQRLRMLPYPSMTVLVNKNLPLSRGRISLVSADPREPPLIDPNLLQSKEDVATLVRGVSVVRRIMGVPAMSAQIKEEVRPGAVWTSDASLDTYVRENAEIAYHPSGTCQMGTGSAAVVSPDLKVRGVSGLWIADASVMPTMISGNINAACMMIGMKLGQALSRGGRR